MEHKGFSFDAYNFLKNILVRYTAEQICYKKYL